MKYIMLVYIDESGDPGSKIAKGSTPNFVIGMIVFSDKNEATKIWNAIEDFRESIKYKKE